MLIGLFLTKLDAISSLVVTLDRYPAGAGRLLDLVLVLAILTIVGRRR